MESHLNYLDELTMAIKRSSATNAKNNVLPTTVPEDGDPNSIELIDMVVNRLLSMHKSDALNTDKLFSKSLILMDLLLTSKPYLLIHTGLRIASASSSKEDIGIIRLINVFVQVSVLHINAPDRIWFIRQKVGQWAALTHQLYGGDYKHIQSKHIESLFETCEKNLTKVLTGNYIYKSYLQNLRITYILCYWLNARPNVFRSSLLLLDSSAGMNRWTLKFQKLIRFILYLFDSTQLPDNKEYTDLQVSFMALTVDHMLNNTVPNPGNTPTLRTMDQFKFCLNVIHRFLKSNIILQAPQSVVFAKSLLRVYSLCFSRSQVDQIRYAIFHTFQKELPILQKSWINNLEMRLRSVKGDVDSPDPIALRAVVLVFFDIQRRMAPDSDIIYDTQYQFHDKHNSSEVYKRQVSESFAAVSPQLEGFRVLILNSFKKNDFLNRLSCHINELDAGILSTKKSLDSFFEEISASITSCFTVKNNQKIIDWVNILSKMVCYEAHNKTTKNINTEGACTLCDANHSPNIYSNIDPDRPDCTKVSKTYKLLVKHFLSNSELSNFNEGLLIGILLCLQRIFVHFQPPELQNTTTRKNSKVFTFVWTCFSSPNRYLRNMASRLIPLWNITNIYNSDSDNTFTLANLLQSVDKNVQIETVAKTWMHLTLTTSGDDFNVLLLKLVEFLASNDAATNLMMEYQIRNLAKILRKTPFQLLSPILPIFLRQTASVFDKRKHVFLKLVNMMGCSAQSLLEDYQAYIIPSAVLQQKSDSFGAITPMMFSNKDGTMEQLVNRLLVTNCRQVYAVALVKYNFFNIDHIRMIFRNILPDFPMLFFSNRERRTKEEEDRFIFETLPDYQTMAEVVKSYLFSETDEEATQENERRVLCSMRYLLTNFAQDCVKGGKYKDVNDWDGIREKAFQKTLSDNFLGIFQVFSRNLHDTNGNNTNFQKLRVVNGIAFLLQHSSMNSIISGLAQISICLQTALEIEEIRYSALRCWYLLIKELDDQELSAVIDGLISYILQKWPTFNAKMKRLAYEILNYIIKEKTKLISEINPYITFALIQKRDYDIELLEGNRAFAKTAGKVVSTTNLIPIFVHNLKSNNLYLIKQTLDDIKIYLERKQVDGRDSALNLSRNDSTFSILLTTLLKTAYKFRMSDPSISKICSKYISMIGMRDITKTSGETAVIDKVCDFNDMKQTINFLIWVINDILVPSFWESENPNKQLFVALVMQESLKYCGLDSGEDDQTTYKIEDHPERLVLWNKFNTISKATLTPLLYSKYHAQSSVEYVPLEYPCYKVSMGYKMWIKYVTLDLIKVSTLDDPTHPLHVFASLMREDDGYISNFLLPYIVIDVLIKANTKQECKTLVKNIVLEFNHIFQKDLNGLNHLQKDSQKMCYTSIFRVLEYGRKWVTEYKKNYNEQNGTHIIKDDNTNKMLLGIEKFLSSIPLSLLAQRSLETNSFERSALYLEQYKRQEEKNDIEDESILKNLQQTYEEIGDIDAVDGILKTFSSESLISKIDELQYSNNWKMAQDCFTVLGTYDLPTATTKMMKSMYDHQLYSTLLETVPRVLTDNANIQADVINECFAYGLEAANLVGKVDSLKFWVEKIESLDNISDPNIVLQYNMAKALLYVNEGKRGLTLDYIDKCYQTIGTHFTTSATATTLVKKQTLLMKLHGLYDIGLRAADIDEVRMDQCNEILDARLEKIGAEFIPNYYLMSLRKSFNLLKDTSSCKEDLFNTYFRMSRLARNNGRLDIASESLMNCLKADYSPTELEFAEILWKQGENDRALKLVQEIHHKYANSQGVNNCDKAKVLLKYTEWLDLSNNSTSAQIIQQYTQILHLDSAWYKPYYSFGQYFSRLIEKRSAEGLSSDGTWEFKSISYFLLAFARNAIHVRENLPKVVTFWLDTTDSAVRYDSESRGTVLQRTSHKICEAIQSALSSCPTYIWYSVLTQLLSRLLHAHKKTADLIKQILYNLTTEFPTHMLWYITVLQNSTVNERVKVGDSIMKKYKGHSGSDASLVKNAQLLTISLTRVSMQEVSKARSRSSGSLENDFKFKMSMAPSQMTVPVRINLTTLSPVSADSMSAYKPFHSDVTISKFGKTYITFSSLKKPKRIDMIGSDGKVYGIMCKKEDVRQDNQYMQFATTMDFILNKEVEATKRDLGITTYSVLSLREDCGILEFIPNVATLRSIFLRQYDSMNVQYNMRQMHAKWNELEAEKRPRFFESQLKKFPPVLHKWFVETFPDPIDWYNARNRYARSYAVMAMLGYILGLGDRHCENILLDVGTGQVLHVDFDCLFDKGKLLPVPEIVPFRLTQNLLDALGVVGTEGTFKKSSEVTLELVRSNETALLNVIETIVYERDSSNPDQVQVAREALRQLRNKIRGIDPRDGLALSVPGQADALIHEAASRESLGQMYIGWMAFW